MWYIVEKSFDITIIDMIVSLLDIPQDNLQSSFDSTIRTVSH